MKADIYKALDIDHPGIRAYLLIAAGADPDDLPAIARDRFQLIGYVKTVDLRNGTERLPVNPFAAMRNLRASGYHLELPPEGLG
jgi:hypothetical protein